MSASLDNISEFNTLMGLTLFLCVIFIIACMKGIGVARTTEFVRTAIESLPTYSKSQYDQIGFSSPPMYSEEDPLNSIIEEVTSITRRSLNSQEGSAFGPYPPTHSYGSFDYQRVT
jgi:hypothetical protein